MLRIVNAQISLDSNMTDITLHITDDPNFIGDPVKLPHELAVQAIQALADTCNVSVQIEGYGWNNEN